MHEVFFLPESSKFWKQTHYAWGVCLPEGSVYHYTPSVMAVKNILSTGELWMSKSTVMNDFTEINYGVDLFNDVVAGISDDTWLMNIVNLFSKDILGSFADFFILSFSLNNNSRLLWDSYSNKNGYNIEFSKELISDFLAISSDESNATLYDKVVSGQQGYNVAIKTYPEECNPPKFRFLAFANSVSYNQDQQRIIINEIIEYIRRYREYDFYTVFSDINMALSSLMQSILFFKHPSLRDEEEYRIVVKIMAEGEPIDKTYLRGVQQYREKDNKLLPYIVLKMKPLEYIKSLSVGYQNSNELSISTMRDFITTISPNIAIKTPYYPLR